jgi:hypothetical protein
MLDVGKRPVVTIRLTGEQESQLGALVRPGCRRKTKYSACSHRSTT